MRVFDFNSAIARLPSETVVNGLRAGTHEGPSHEGVMREHRTYLEALRTAGLEVTLLPPLPEFPDSMFVEDPALVFPEGAILLRPGAPSREREAAHLAAALSERFDEVLDLPEGHVDGGDVLIGAGLAVGDRVVTEGQFRLKTGAKVKALAPGEVAAPAQPPTDAAKRGKPAGAPRTP